MNEVDFKEQLWLRFWCLRHIPDIKNYACFQHKNIDSKTKPKLLFKIHLIYMGHTVCNTFGISNLGLPIFLLAAVPINF